MSTDTQKPIQAATFYRGIQQNYTGVIFEGRIDGPENVVHAAVVVDGSMTAQGLKRLIEILKLYEDSGVFPDLKAEAPAMDGT